MYGHLGLIIPIGILSVRLWGEKLEVLKQQRQLVFVQQHWGRILKEIFSLKKWLKIWLKIPSTVIKSQLNIKPFFKRKFFLENRTPEPNVYPHE